MRYLGVSPDTTTAPLPMLEQAPLTMRPPETVAVWPEPEEAQTLFGYFRSRVHRKTEATLDPQSIELPSSPAFTTTPAENFLPELPAEPPMHQPGSLIDEVMDQLEPFAARPIEELDPRARLKRQERFYYLYTGIVAVLGAGVFEFEQQFHDSPAAQNLALTGGGALAIKLLIDGVRRHFRKQSEEKTLNELKKILK